MASRNRWEVKSSIHGFPIKFSVQALENYQQFFFHHLMTGSGIRPLGGKLDRKQRNRSMSLSIDNISVAASLLKMKKFIRGYYFGGN